MWPGEETQTWWSSQKSQQSCLFYIVLYQIRVCLSDSAPCLCCVPDKCQRCYWMYVPASSPRRSPSHSHSWSVSSGVGLTSSNVGWLVCHARPGSPWQSVEALIVNNKNVWLSEVGLRIMFHETHRVICYLPTLTSYTYQCFPRVNPLFVAQTHKHAFLTELLNNTFIFYVLCNYFNWLYFEWVSLQSKATVSDCRWWMHPWSPCCYATSTTLAKGHMSQFSNFLQFLVRMAISSQWSSRGEQRLLLLAAVQSVWPQDEIFSEEAAERCGKMVQKQTQKSWR